MASLDRATRTTNATTNLPDNVTQDISPLDVRQGRLDNIDSAFSLPDDYETGTFTISLTDLGGGATYSIAGGINGLYRRWIDMVWYEVDTNNLISMVGNGSGLLQIDGFPFTQTGAAFLNVGTFSTDNINWYSVQCTLSGTSGFIRIQTALDGTYTSASSVDFTLGSIALSGLCRVSLP